MWHGLPNAGAHNPGYGQPRSQSSSAISDVTSPVKLVGKIMPEHFKCNFFAIKSR